MRFHFALIVLACACADSESARDAGADGGFAIAPHVSAALRACAQNPRSVSSVGAVVDLINELPRPVSIGCVVASLKRPLKVVTAQSFISAQLAYERTNPRIFILEPGLVISVVPVGSGAPLLEMGQWVTPQRTLKAEVLMPVTEVLHANEPFDHVISSPGRTTCGFCHRSERADATVDGGYVTDAYRPPDNALVPLSVAAAEHQACVETGDAPDAGERCSYFHALFDFGPVESSAFESNVPLFQ